MRRKELLQLIANGETSTVEFKRKATTIDKLAKEICAFANTKGGFLIVGVDDNRAIVGVKSEKTEIDMIITTCKFHVFPETAYEIEIFQIQGKDIIIVSIPQSLAKPHKIKLLDEEKNKEFFRAYIRTKDKSVIASKEMTNLMKFVTENKPLQKITTGKSEQTLFEYLKKNERITVKEFAKVANISNRRAERLLIQLVYLGIIQINTDTHQDFFTMT